MPSSQPVPTSTVLGVARSIVCLCAGIAGMFLMSGSPAFAQSNGFYFGLTGGYGWGTGAHTSQVNPVVMPPEPDDGHYRLSGIAAGPTIGYAIWMDKVLLGAEADYSVAWIDGSGVCTVSRCSGDVRTFGTARGRLGYDLGGWAIYATAGLALADFKASSATAPGYSGSELRTGWTVGVGVEHPINIALSWKLEYLYADFGREAHFTISGHSPEKIDFSVSIVRLGLNLKLTD